MGFLRFLLALSVVVGHAGGLRGPGYQLVPGATAVQCFYVISGFLITMVLNENAAYQNVARFYISRYLRLWPAYAVVALASLIFWKWGTIVETLPRVVDLPGQAAIAFSNVTLFFQDWLLFTRLDAEGALSFTADFRDSTPQVWTFLLVPQAWTLGVELTFYLIAPLLVRNWRTLLALFFVGLAVRVAIAQWHPPFDPWSYRFAPAEMTFFAVGGLAYFVSRRLWADRQNAAFWTGAASVTLIIAIVPISGALHALPVSSWIQRTLYLNNWVTILLTVLAVGPLFYGLRKNRIDDFLGELSYPIYICHYLVLRLLGASMPVSWHRWGVIQIAASLACSVALLYLVIRPVDQFRKRYSHPARSARPGLGSSPG